MQHDPRAWLWDVRRAADRIATYIAPHDFEKYQADSMLRDAVERQLEIIGEALNRLSRESPDLAERIPDLRKAVAMRNVLIHAYRDVDNAEVWRTVQSDLPILRATVAALLSELGEQP